VDGDGSAVQSVFRTDGSDLVLIDVGKRYGVGDRKLQIRSETVSDSRNDRWWAEKAYPSSFSLLDGDVGRLLVQSDPDTLQFICQDLQIVQGLQDVEHDEDQVTRPCNWIRHSELAVVLVAEPCFATVLCYTHRQ
jgi:hypothetical protein